MTVASSTPNDQRPAHTLTSEEALTRAGVEAAKGLSADEAATRLDRYGPNRFAEAKTEPTWLRFLRQYEDLMQLVLLGAGIVSIFVVDQLSTGVLLLFLTAANALMGLNQEGKAAAAVSALQEMMIVTARVRRGGELTEVPADQLVPGDVVAIEAGDLVTADGRLLSSATLEVDESALTGESLPVAKDAAVVGDVDTPLGDRLGMVFMNTSVTRGSATFVVTATGMATEVGHISELLESADELETPLTRQIDGLTRQLIAIAGLALIASMVIGLVRGESFDVLFVAAVAFAVAAIPTGLPTIVTTILSQSTRTLAAAGAIVKRLRSVETLGSTSAINSDKTGTLTMNQMTAVEMSAMGRHFQIDGSGYGTEGNILRDGGPPEQPLDALLLPMVLASDAVVRNGELVGDPTEGALVVLAAKGGLGAEPTREAYPRVATLPFDAAYKLMATFHRVENESGKAVVRAFVKGAPDQLMERSVKTLDEQGKLTDFDAAARDEALADNERLGSKGLRVMAVGRKDIDPKSFDAGADLLAQLDGLTLLALVGIVDPPRPAAKDSIATAQRAGITVRMITGDHVATAEAIGRQLGIVGRAISGADFRALADEEALRQLPDIGIIARVTPEDKVHLVELLQRQGHIVAMTGDGVNDAPALKQADIGVAMGITGTEVSKEAAVMILTDDDFSTIVRAVRLGRQIYDNLKKYIRFQMAGLFGFVATFLGASIFWIAAGLPFLPGQTIWVNFTVQASQALGLGFGAPKEGLMDRKPRPSDAPLLSRLALAYLAVVGLVMGVITLTIISLASREYGEAVGRSMGLAAFSFMNIGFSLSTKDIDTSIFKSGVLSDRTLAIATTISVIVTIAASELNMLQRLLSTVSLSFNQWVVCALAGVAIVAISEVRKALWKPQLDDVAAEGEPVMTERVPA